MRILYVVLAMVAIFSSSSVEAGRKNQKHGKSATVTASIDAHGEATLFAADHSHRDAPVHAAAVVKCSPHSYWECQEQDTFPVTYLATLHQVCQDPSGNKCTPCTLPQIKYLPLPCHQTGGKCSVDGHPEITCSNVKPAPKSCAPSYNSFTCDPTTGKATGVLTCHRTDGSPCTGCNPGFVLPVKDCTCNGKTCSLPDGNGATCTCSEACNHSVASYACHAPTQKNGHGVAVPTIQWTTPSGKKCHGIQNFLPPTAQCDCCSGKCKLEDASITAPCTSCSGTFTAGFGCACDHVKHCTCTTEKNTGTGTALITPACAPDGCQPCVLPDNQQLTTCSCKNNHCVTKDHQTCENHVVTGLHH